ncbi:MAG: hypothetical protein AAB819_01685 [Patescibacteria group bacterium]
MADQFKRKISFGVNDQGWVMLSDLLGKVVLRATKIKDKGRVSDEINQHRCFEYECEGTVRVQSKLYDISEFVGKDQLS